MSELDKRVKLSAGPNDDAVLVRALQAFADLERNRYPDASDLIEQAALVFENARKPIPYDHYKQ